MLQCIYPSPSFLTLIAAVNVSENHGRVAEFVASVFCGQYMLYEYSGTVKRPPEGPVIMSVMYRSPLVDYNVEIIPGPTKRGSYKVGVDFDLKST